MRQVANAHSMFNILNCIVFLPLVPLLAKLCRIIIPDDKARVGEAPDIVLDFNLLETPVLAIDTLNREMGKMAEYSGECLLMASEHFLTGRHEPGEIVRMEDRVDVMQRDMTDYASKLFQGELSREQSLSLPVIIHSINDLERVFRPRSEHHGGPGQGHRGRAFEGGLCRRWPPPPPRPSWR
jgi:phosphate:Na+ symporter